jgi:signal transduction histidine kinase
LQKAGFFHYHLGMIQLGRRWLFWFCLIGALAVLLTFLSVLEYRWAADVGSGWLALNFGVLIVLALALVTIVLSVLRAQRLLRLQMEFVAGISHELRTPLAVIGSAADNLAEGVIRTDSDVREYGALIRGECRRLSGLVEQILRFSASKADTRPCDIRFFRVSDVIHKVLSAAAFDSDHFTVEKSLDPNLPLVRADPNLLSDCLLNLVSNAIKYGGERQWLAIRAHTVETGHGTGIQITVEDRGIGIPPNELSQIFEPFYRGCEARSAQIRGTGLGLSLAREAANSMGARITVKSTLGKGSAFTLHIPAAYMNSSTVPLEALVEW